jgi:hypothetical protein
VCCDLRNVRVSNLATSAVRRFHVETSAVRRFHVETSAVRRFDSETSAVRRFCSETSAVRRFCSETSAVRRFRSETSAVRRFYCETSAVRRFTAKPAASRCAPPLKRGPSLVSCASYQYTRPKKFQQERHLSLFHFPWGVKQTWHVRHGQKTINTSARPFGGAVSDPANQQEVTLTLTTPVDIRSVSAGRTTTASRWTPLPFSLSHANAGILPELRLYPRERERERNSSSIEQQGNSGKGGSRKTRPRLAHSVRGRSRRLAVAHVAPPPSSSSSSASFVSFFGARARVCCCFDRSRRGL